MAFPYNISGNDVWQGVRTTGSMNTDFIKVDIEDRMYRVEPSSYPLQAYLFMQKNKAIETVHPQTKHEWPEDELTPASDKLTAGATGGGATMNIYPTEIDLYFVGMRVKFPDTDETGYVSSVAGYASSYVTVTKDTGTWTTLASGAYVKLLGYAGSENGDPPTMVSTKAVVLFNYCQIFQTSVKMTDRQIMASMGGGFYAGNWWDNEVDKKGKEHKLGIENSMWHNTIAQAARQSDYSYKTLCNGVIQQIIDGGGLYQPYSKWDEEAFDLFLLKKKLGSNNLTFFVGDDLAYDCEKIVKLKYGNIGQVKKYGAVAYNEGLDVFTYQGVGKTVDIIRVPSPIFDDKYSKMGVLLDDGYIKLVHAGKDKKGSRKQRFEMGIQANGQPREEAQFLSDVSPCVVNPAIHQICYAQ